MKRRNVYPFIFLTCLTIMIVYFIMPSLSIFGSNTDWLSQHVNLADYIRNVMLENKTILLLTLVLDKIFIIYLTMVYSE